MPRNAHSQSHAGGCGTLMGARPGRFSTAWSPRPMSEFMAMGGVGIYVWMACGITAVIVVVNLIEILVHRRNTRHERGSRL